jgi:hypothetical protein
MLVDDGSSPKTKNHELKTVNWSVPPSLSELLNEIIIENQDEVRHAIMNESKTAFPCFPMWS